MFETDMMTIYVVCYTKGSTLWPTCVVGILQIIVFSVMLVLSAIVQVRILKKAERKRFYLQIYCALFLKMIFEIVKDTLISAAITNSLNATFTSIFYYLLLIDFLMISKSLEQYIFWGRKGNAIILAIVTVGVVYKVYETSYDFKEESCTKRTKHLLDMIQSLLITIYCVIFMILYSAKIIKSKLKRDIVDTNDICSYRDKGKSSQINNDNPYLQRPIMENLNANVEYERDNVTKITALTIDDGHHSMRKRVTLYEKTDGAYEKARKNLKWFIVAMCINTAGYYFINTVKIYFFYKVYICVDDYYLHPKNNYVIIDIVLGTIVALCYAIIINKFFYYDQLESNSKDLIKQNMNKDIRIQRKTSTVSGINNRTNSILI